MWDHNCKNNILPSYFYYYWQQHSFVKWVAETPQNQLKRFLMNLSAQMVYVPRIVQGALQGAGSHFGRNLFDFFAAGKSSHSNNRTAVMWILSISNYIILYITRCITISKHNLNLETFEDYVLILIRMWCVSIRVLISYILICPVNKNKLIYWSTRKL